MRIKSYRITSQTFFFIISILGIVGVTMTGLIYPFFFCYSCPFAVAACPLGIMEHAAIDIVLMGVMEGLMLFAYVLGFLSVIGIIFGRSFCGWACPIGFLQDGINKVRQKFLKKLVGNRLDIDRPYLKYLKYIFIPFIPIASYFTLELFYTRYCPIGGITGTIPTLLLSPGQWEPSTYFPIKIISIIMFFILVFVVGRGWCRFLCPVGAIFAPFNKISMIQLERTDDCKQCEICSESCPMQIKSPGTEDDPECVLCGRCIESCEYDALKFKFKWWKKDE